MPEKRGTQDSREKEPGYKIEASTYRIRHLQVEIAFFSAVYSAHTSEFYRSGKGHTISLANWRRISSNLGSDSWVR